MLTIPLAWIFRFYLFSADNIYQFWANLLRDVHHGKPANATVSSLFNGTIFAQSNETALMVIDQPTVVKVTAWARFQSMALTAGRDCFTGQLVTCAVVVSFIAVFLLREWITQQAIDNAMAAPLPAAAVAAAPVPAPEAAAEAIAPIAQAVLDDMRQVIEEAHNRQVALIRQEAEAEARRDIAEQQAVADTEPTSDTVASISEPVGHAPASAPANEEANSITDVPPFIFNSRPDDPDRPRSDLSYPERGSSSLQPVQADHIGELRWEPFSAASSSQANPAQPQESPRATTFLDGAAQPESASASGGAASSTGDTTQHDNADADQGTTVAVLAEVEIGDLQAPPAGPQAREEPPIIEADMFAPEVDAAAAVDAGIPEEDFFQLDDLENLLETIGMRGRYALRFC